MMWIKVSKSPDLVIEKKEDEKSYNHCTKDYLFVPRLNEQPVTIKIFIKITS
jgi:hypothetical protein